MYSKGIAVVAITRRGVATALKIKNALDSQGLPCTVYAPEKYSQNGTVTLDNKLPEFIKETYSKVNAIVAVMATGIIIRAVAPYLESKLTDPAVIGVDAQGKFVISLLSGHYGGANELTKLIAKGIDANAVITTASEVAGKLSVDELARKLHFTIQNPQSLVAVNAAIVNEDRIVLVLIDDVKMPTETVSCFEMKKADRSEQALDIVSNYDAGIIVTGETLSIGNSAKPITVLKPKKIVVGLGARKHSSSESIVEAVNTALERIGLPLERIGGFATVDIKRDSPAMIEVAEKMGLPLEFLSVNALRSLRHGDLSPDSKLVEEKIGVGGVSERAALISAGKDSRLILKKMKLNGVTVAIAEAE